MTLLASWERFEVRFLSNSQVLDSIRRMKEDNGKSNVSRNANNSSLIAKSVNENNEKRHSERIRQLLQKVTRLPTIGLGLDDKIRFLNYMTALDRKELKT